MQYVSQWGVAGTLEIRTGKVSGEVVEGDMLSEAQDCIVTSINVNFKAIAKKGRKAFLASFLTSILLMCFAAGVAFVFF